MSFTAFEGRRKNLRSEQRRERRYRAPGTTRRGAVIPERQGMGRAIRRASSGEGLGGGAWVDGVRWPDLGPRKLPWDRAALAGTGYSPGTGHWGALQTSRGRGTKGTRKLLWDGALWDGALGTQT